MKTAKINAYTMYIFGKIELYLYLQPKIISKCITLMTYKRQRHTVYIAHWKYGRNMTFMDLVSDRTLVTTA